MRFAYMSRQIQALFVNLLGTMNSNSFLSTPIINIPVRFWTYYALRPISNAAVGFCFMISHSAARVCPQRNGARVRDAVHLARSGCLQSGLFARLAVQILAPSRCPAKKPPLSRWRYD